MKKKLLAVMLSVFMAASALPEATVMAAAVQETAGEATVGSGSSADTETDSDNSSSESKTETVESTSSGTNSESRSEKETDGTSDNSSGESAPAATDSSTDSSDSKAADTSSDTSSDAASQSDKVKDGVFEYQKISPAEVEIIAMEKPEETDVVIPDEVTDGENKYSVVSVKKDALSKSAVESIQISSTVKKFESQELKNLRTIVVAPGNETFFTKDGVLFAREEMPEGTAEEDLKFDLVLYPSASEEKEYVIPKQTAVINTGAFFEPANLRTIALQEGIEELQEKAFVSPANALEIAFDLEKVPAKLAKQVFYLDKANGNKIYFKSQEVLDAFKALELLFADSPLMYDTDGVILSDYADVIAYSGEGIPKEIKKLINKANGVEDEEEEEEVVGVGQDAQIAEGYYKINTLLSDSMFLKINNATVDAGGNVQIGAETADTADIFKITPLGDGLYTITAFCSNKAVSLNGTTVSNTLNVLQKDYTGDLSQKWYIQKAATAGTVTIASAVDPKFVLDVSGGVSSEGQNVWAYSSNKSKAQTWKFTTVSDPTADAPANGIYFIHNVRNSDRVVDVYMGSAENCANVWLYDYNGTRAQQFYLRSLGFGNLYTIVNVYSNKSLDAYNNQTTSGTNIWQYTQNNTSAQMWRLVKNSDGSYTILGAKSNLAFDLYMGWTENGTNIWLYTQNGTNAQKWVLKEAGDVAGMDVSGADKKVAAGYYTIVPENATSKNLNVSKASLKNNANIELNSTFYHEGETFYVEPTDDGKYKITSFCSGGKALTAGWGEDGNGYANVKQSDYTGDSGQQWYIRVSAKNKDYVTICSSNDQNYVLNAAGKSNGSNVNLVLSSGEKSQRWKLVPAADPNANALAAGTYKIRNVAAQSRVISVEGRVSGANVYYSNENNARTEFFTIEPVGYGSLYFIKNSTSGLSLDVYGGNTASGTNVWAYTANNTVAQMWRILPTDKGYAVMSANADLALDLYNGSTADGTNIWVYDQNGTNAQKWMFTEAKMDEALPLNTKVIIRSKANTSRMIEVKDGASNAGATVQLYDERQNTSQVFTIEKYGQYYRIVNLASGNVIDIYNGSKDENAKAWSYTWNASSAQQYTIESTGDGDGSFYIRNINSWLYLTAKSTSNGAQIVQAAKTGDNKQKWYFDTPILRKGWHKESGGYRYYDSAGNLVRNSFLEDGKYYVDGNGYAYTGWKKYGSYYYYYKGKDGQEKTDARPYLINLFGATSRGGQTCPNTTYRLVVDNAAPCIVTVYTRYPGTSGWNLPVFSFLCSPGVGGSYVTDYGERLTRNKYRWKDLMGPSYGQYATELLAYTYPAGSGGSYMDWTNNGEYFHSVACPAPNNANLDPNTYNLLGTRQSHGCVRVCVRYAYWLYTFCDSNTTCYVGQYLARPFNVIPQPMAWDVVDPTDPAYTNNYGYTDNGATYHANGYFPY